jgi:hypothetical protein
MSNEHFVNPVGSNAPHIVQNAVGQGFDEYGISAGSYRANQRCGN